MQCTGLVNTTYTLFWNCTGRYGALEGLSKPQLAKELGAEIVQSWRSSFDIRPPPMTEDHPYWHQKERKYSDLDIPLTESLEDTMERTLPLWKARILPELENGKNVLIVAHGNSLRGTCYYLRGLLFNCNYSVFNIFIVDSIYIC